MIYDFMAGIVFRNKLVSFKYEWNDQLGLIDAWNCVRCGSLISGRVHNSTQARLIVHTS